ncbi:MAG: cytidine deaminase [Gemmatimonadota bacterium]|nr:cytidine deaminase [Gemmatimonadota bacterium]
MAGIDSESELLSQAREVMDRAYAPYSGFRVGAALEAADGRVFLGCNVENASYPVGTCAERVALGHAVASGARAFRRVAVASSGDRPASPCGMCRQALSEFGVDLEILSVAAGGEVRRWSLADLLPADFRLDEADPAGVARRGG